jgi:hypothetical protein
MKPSDKMTFIACNNEQVMNIIDYLVNVTKDIQAKNNRIQIPVVTVSENAISEHFPENYEQENIERCAECGSSLFRIYKEPVPEGTYEQTICAICNNRTGGYVNDWRKKIQD